MTAPAAPAPALTWRLRGHLGGKEHVFELTPGREYRVGSSARSDLWLPGLGVSREHGLLRMTPGGPVVLDRGSKNGTFVDGRRVERAGLIPGAVVAFGPVELLLEAVDDEDLALAISFEIQGPPPRPQRPTVSRETVSCAPGAAEASTLTLPPGHVRGRSNAMAALYRRMAAVTASSLPVLVVGETGVGKEGLVRILHDSGPRRAGPLVTLNCAAVPTELFEAELFGIGRGVATGVDPRPGKVRAAHGGTLFLDEIGEMPLPLQAKLLRVLQENEIQPLGLAAETVDVRVVAATNVNLERRMALGDFRRDLYYRLAGSVLKVPPLRSRRSDIPALVEHFVRRASGDAGLGIRGVTVKAMSALLSHDWPGNVRELELAVHRAVLHTADGGVIDAHRVGPFAPSTDPASSAQPRSPNGDGSGALALEKQLNALEGSLIRRALGRTRGRQNRAAELLGISRSGLARRLERLGIDYRTYR